MLTFPTLEIGDAKLCATAKFSKNIVEEIQEDLTANDIGQILWGHWLEIGDIGRHWGNWADIADSKYA